MFDYIFIVLYKMNVKKYINVSDSCDLFDFDFEKCDFNFNVSYYIISGKI